MFQNPDGHWSLSRPDDTFLRLRVSSRDAAALAQILRGDQPLSSLLIDHPDQASLVRLLHAFDDAGLLDLGEGRSTSLEGRRVAVCGFEPLVMRVVELLKTTPIAVTAALDPAVEPNDPLPEVIVACATWLPDARWQALDAWCTEHGVAWHMAYQEGTRFFVGPMAVTGRTATYRDVRARRLAAATAPGELRALWHHLDTTPPPSPTLQAPQGAMVASILVTDVFAFLAGEHIPTEGHQMEIDPSTMTIVRHPVLPLPPELRNQEPQ